MTGNAPPVRTRFEPSPSGSIHVGTAMTCLFNWLLARRHGGSFVLRVADTDRSRVVDEGLRSVTEDLRWLGLVWDEGPEVGGPHEPYFQSERAHLYGEAAARLVATGAAYRCFCTPAELEEQRERARAEKRPFKYDKRCRTLTDAERATKEAAGIASVVRFAVPDGNTSVTDLVRGDVVFDHADVDDFVVLRADGSALYNLAVSYDDMSMGITHIIRGEDIFASTPKQILLMKAWGAERLPSYGHVPLIVGTDRKPLGKRHGDTAVAQYRDKGFLPEVILNYLATLSWSVGDGATERFTIEELVASFDTAGITRNPSAFDVMKLESWNGDSIRTLPRERFIDLLERFLERDGVKVDRARLERIAPHVQERMKRLDEATPQLRFLFVEQVEPDEKARTKLNADLLAGARAVVADVDWTVEAITEAMMAWADGSGVKRKDALQPVRAAVTGSLVSPPLFESIEVLGREATLARIDAAIALVRDG